MGAGGGGSPVRAARPPPGCVVPQGPPRGWGRTAAPASEPGASLPAPNAAGLSRICLRQTMQHAAVGKQALRNVLPWLWRGAGISRLLCTAGFARGVALISRMPEKSVLPAGIPLWMALREWAVMRWYLRGVAKP